MRPVKKQGHGLDGSPGRAGSGQEKTRLSADVATAMKGRDLLLPGRVLEQYVGPMLQKREVFLESASRFRTPQYFFDEPSLDLHISQFQAAFRTCFERYRLFYAMKSNSFPGIAGHAAAAGLGLEVSSGFELHRALRIRCRDILFNGPGKTDDELRLAIQNRDRVTLLLDSFGELQRLSDILKGQRIEGPDLRVGVRVRSPRQGIWNKFGIPLKDLTDMLKNAMAVKGLAFCGIQFHTSWNLDPCAQINMIHEIGSYIRLRMPRRYWKSLEFLDIGGGFWPEQGEWLNPQNTLKGRLRQCLDPEVRFESRHYWHKASPLVDFTREISSAIAVQGPPLCDLEVRAEPGRWISTPSMHILLMVIDKKDSRTVITDGGTNLLGWERPLEEFIPVINLSKPALKERPVRVFGSLCTPHDLWGTSFFGSEIDPGDILLIPDQGSYTYSLRQSFIKPRSRVIRYDGVSLDEVEKEEGLRHA